MDGSISSQRADGEVSEVSRMSIPPSNPMKCLLETVVHLINDNISHFEHDESELGQRLHCGFRALNDGISNVTELCEIVRREAVYYDFSSETPGNGFRSFINVVHQAITSVFTLCKKIATDRSSILPLRKGHYVKEVEAWGLTFASLSTLLKYLTTVLLPKCTDGNLIPEIDSSPTELLETLNTVSQYSFYGRCLGFHFHESLHRILRFLNISMCAFSEIYYSDGGFVKRTKQSILTGSKYVLNPEQRARRIVDVVQYASVDFIKSFWSLADTDLLTQLPVIVGPSLAVHQPIIVPCENYETKNMKGEAIIIPSPSSHFPPRPIPSYLLSSTCREGMPGEQKSKIVLPPSPCIIFHCHGGGFVTQSTKAQEMYLREWVSGLNVPLFSVDYSLAPEARYPRPLEEVLTAYVWMLDHFNLLGTTGEKIICTGDSAGGNLISGLTIKCIELDIRIPDGLFMAYTPFSVKLSPTPARLLGVMDPMLPLGFALRCLKAYATIPSATSSLTSSPIKSTASDISQNIPKSLLEDEIINTADKSELSSNSSSKKDTDSTPPIQETLNESSDIDESFVEVSEEDAIEAEQEIKSMVKSSSVLSEADTENESMTTVSLTSETSKAERKRREELMHKEEKEKRSKQYVTEFLEKYVLDTKIDSQGNKVPVIRTDSVETDDGTGSDSQPAISDSTFSGKIGRAKGLVMGRVSSSLSSISKWKSKPKTPSPESLSPVSPTGGTKVKRTPSFGQISLGTCKLDRNYAPSLVEEFSGIEVIDDIYISPLLADREILAKFPPTSILTVEYDFCLDDCVTMAKVLRSLGVPVHLDILDRLPHGFLNLCQASKEAFDGCRLACRRLGDLLGKEEERGDVGGE